MPCTQNTDLAQQASPVGRRHIHPISCPQKLLWRLYWLLSILNLLSYFFRWRLSDFSHTSYSLRGRTLGLGMSAQYLTQPWHGGTCQSKERLFAMVANSRAFFISTVFQVLRSFSARKYHQVLSLPYKGLDKSWQWSLLCSILCLDPLRLCFVREVRHAHHAPSREWKLYFPCNFCAVTFLPSVIFPLHNFSSPAGRIPWL